MASETSNTRIRLLRIIAIGALGIAILILGLLLYLVQFDWLPVFRAHATDGREQVEVYIRAIPKGVEPATVLEMDERYAGAVTEPMSLYEALLQMQTTGNNFIRNYETMGFFDLAVSQATVIVNGIVRGPIPNKRYDPSFIYPNTKQGEYLMQVEHFGGNTLALVGYFDQKHNSIRQVRWYTDPHDQTKVIIIDVEYGHGTSRFNHTFITNDGQTIRITFEDDSNRLRIYGRR